MAKSIRSKRKRMLRNIKRKRYAAKELIRLKKMLGIKVEPETEDGRDQSNVIEIIAQGHDPVESETVKEECDDSDRIINLCSFVANGKVIFDADEISSSSDDQEEKDKESSGKNNEEMDHSHKRVFNKKTMKDQFGSYPIWFKSKDIKKRQMAAKIQKKKLKKQKKLEIRNGRVKKKKNSKRFKMQKQDQGNSMEITTVE